MNSPPQPASPSPSTPSSGSPPPDEVIQTLSPSTPKRPLPSSSSMGSGTKSRRKVDHGQGSQMGSRRTGGGSMMWSEGVRDGGRKEDLVDVSFTDKLKKAIGDPFDDSALYKAS